MIISIIGSIYQKCPPEILNTLLQTIVAGSSEHYLRIDKKFYDYLQGMGISLPEECADDVRGFPKTDILLSIGGDGTFLRAAKLIAGTSAVILGINTGRLGFLAESSPSEVAEMWADIIHGRYETEERSMLEVTVLQDDKHRTFPPALNEIAILKRDTASMISVYTTIDHDPVATFEGDGLLISTPTGSTAYSLSVGGPIIHPESPVLLLAPVAPHTLNMRPLVIPDTAHIEMKVSTRNDAILLSTDGYSTPLPGSVSISVKRSSKCVRIIKHPIHTFFHTLRQKLMWGQAPRNL